MPVILTIHERASESMSMTEQSASAGFRSLRLRLQSGRLADTDVSISRL